MEELSFKTSMIGYDKDEVDIQLDKICDEIEAIVKEKDDEIAALRSGTPKAPVVVDLESGKKEKAVHVQDGEAEALTAQIRDLTQKLYEAENRVAKAEEKAETAEIMKIEAENQAEAAEAKLASYEEQLAAAKAEVDDLREQLDKAAESQDENGLKETAEEPDAGAKAAGLPGSTDEAYQLYMKNADLLCRQLAAVDAQKEAAIAEATKEAEMILAEAKAEESRILGEAREEADRINAAYEGRIEEAEKEAERILADSRTRLEENEDEYQMLLDKKSDLLDSMKDIQTDIGELISMVEESLSEEMDD